MWMCILCVRSHLFGGMLQLKVRVCAYHQMFMGCPSDHFQYPLDALGGVRIICPYMPAPIRSADSHMGARLVDRDQGYSFVSVDFPRRNESFTTLY